MKLNPNTPTEATSKATRQERRIERAIASVDAYTFEDRSETYGEPAARVTGPSGTGYLVFSTACTCPDDTNRLRGTGVLCKHRVMAQLKGLVMPKTAAEIEAEDAERLSAQQAERTTAEIEAHAEELESVSGLEWFPPVRPTDEAELAEWEEMQRAAWRAEQEAADHDAERSARRQWGK